MEQVAQNIQASIVPVDVNSVHDKLLTSFVGGTAADIVHDEAADIAGFTQQGYLANLSPLLSKKLKASIPQSLWDTVNFGGKITGVPLLLQTYNVFANMDILKQAGIKAPTLANPWTWAQFRASGEEAHDTDRYGVCWGLRSPTATIQTMALNYGGQFFYLENGKWAFKWGAAEQNVVKQMHDMIARRQEGRLGCDRPLGKRRAACILRRQVRDDGAGQLPGAGDDPAVAEGLQLGDVPAAQGQDAGPGREPADALGLRSRASTRRRRCSSSST